MGKIKNAMRIMGELADAHYEHQQKVDNMTRELMRRGATDPVETRKIADILVRRAEITWKN